MVLTGKCCYQMMIEVKCFLTNNVYPCKQGLKGIFRWHLMVGWSVSHYSHSFWQSARKPDINGWSASSVDVLDAFS